jgi:hypothetical protein
MFAGFKFIMDVRRFQVYYGCSPVSSLLWMFAGFKFQVYYGCSPVSSFKFIMDVRRFQVSSLLWMFAGFKFMRTNAILNQLVFSTCIPMNAVHVDLCMPVCRRSYSLQQH